MKNKTKKALCAASILGVVAISGIFAYLTDTDEKKNQFTIGNVEIELLEPAWEITEENKSTVDKNDNEIPDFAENIVPNQEIDKDPSIKNKGTTDAYVFMEVLVPMVNASTVDDSGDMKLVSTDGKTDLFTYTYDDTNWGRLSSEVVEQELENGETASFRKSIYYYKGTEDGILAAGAETAPLFEKVVVRNIADLSGIPTETTDLPGGTWIDVKAYAIQSDLIPDDVKLDDGEGGTIDPADEEGYAMMMANIFGIYENQTSISPVSPVPFNPLDPQVVE